ncbi:MAG: hypothetical protein WC378_11900, partial [Opitutaceae bacterium]
MNPGIKEVVLACGEAPAPGWLDHFRTSVNPCEVVVRVLPELGYVAELRGQYPRLRGKLRAFFDDVFGGPGAEGCIAWAHNQSLGRNLIATRELARSCSAHKRLLVLHHHDWWFDNRWQRWREMRECGARTLASVAKALLPHSPGIRH